MENASKALLIAGAILICILLIGVGMLVFNSTQGLTDEATRQGESQAIEAFNSQFTTFEKDKQSGSNVKALMNKIKVNNSQLDEREKVIYDINQDTSDPKYIVTDGDVKIENGTIKNLNTSSYYSVTTSDTNGDGFVDKVTVNKYSKASGGGGSGT